MTALLPKEITAILQPKETQLSYFYYAFSMVSHLKMGNPATLLLEITPVQLCAGRLHPGAGWPFACLRPTICGL